MVLCFARRLQQASSVDDQGKDKDASFKDDSVEVLTAFHCNSIQFIAWFALILIKSWPSKCRN